MQSMIEHHSTGRTSAGRFLYCAHSTRQRSSIVDDLPSPATTTHTACLCRNVSPRKLSAST